MFLNKETGTLFATIKNAFKRQKNSRPSAEIKGGFQMNRKGFTLIEMLIVVAIIGILAALLIPNAMSAVQKAKQKGTIKDINSVAAALTDYLTDKGNVPEHNGQLTGPNDPLIQAVQGFYLKVFPWKDQWGYAFVVNTRDACNSNWNISYADGSSFGEDEFVVGSFGRNGSEDNQYDPTNPSAGLYEVTKMADFNFDIVNWDGSLVIGPRTAAGTGT